jgi:DNA-binding response OmpR family regulator
MQSDTTKIETKEQNSNMDIRDGLVVEIIGGLAVIIIIFFWRQIIRFFGRLIKAVRFQKFDKLKIKYSLEELKRNLKIIVIDDDSIFPVDGFKEFGYSIESWNKLTVQKLRQLHQGEFDIVILDIYGVAKDLAERDGLDVLLEIKTKNPAQVVVAYSGQSFDFSKNKFWELADEKLTKPTPFIGTQSIIDTLIEKTFTISYHKDKIEKILNENKVGEQLNQVEDMFVKARVLNSEPDWVSLLQFLKINHSEIMKLKSILSKLYRLSTIK